MAVSSISNHLMASVAANFGQSAQAMASVSSGVLANSNAPVSTSVTLSAAGQALAASPVTQEE